MEKQVSNEELLELTRKAFEKDEVVDFLQGINGYACPINRFVPANIPTDFGRILEFGIYKLYSETKNKEIINKFIKALHNLIDGDAVQIWIAFMMICNQMIREKRNEALFNISGSDLIERLKTAIHEHETELRTCKEWQGWNEENGLWQEITRINGIHNKKYEVNLL